MVKGTGVSEEPGKLEVRGESFKTPRYRTDTLFRPATIVYKKEPPE